MQRNGLELDELNGIADAIRNEPEAGMVTIRTRHRWDGGFAVDGHAHEIENAGEVTTRTFAFRTDWPTDVGGRDTGPTPGEVVLAALGGCVGMTYILKAAARGVDISELAIDIEAGWDARALFELDSVRAGLSRIVVTMGVRSDATDGVLDDIGVSTTRTSAVYNSLADPVPIELSVRRME